MIGSNLYEVNEDELVRAQIFAQFVKIKIKRLNIIKLKKIDLFHTGFLMKGTRERDGLHDV